MLRYSVLLTWHIPLTSQWRTSKQGQHFRWRGFIFPFTCLLRQCGYGGVLVEVSPSDPSFCKLQTAVAHWYLLSLSHHANHIETDLSFMCFFCIPNRAHHVQCPPHPRQTDPRITEYPRNTEVTVCTVHFRCCLPGLTFRTHPTHVWPA